MVFILKHEYKISKRTFTALEFKPNKFGMYSQAIQDAIVFLKNTELIGDNKEDEFDLDDLIGEDDEINRPTEYVITNKGKDFVEQIITSCKEEDQEKINKILADCLDVKNRFNACNLKTLLRYAYEKYPKFTINSVILAEILGGK
jgi:uncharacterized protein YwgA